MEDIKISFEFLQRKHLPELVNLYQSIFNKKVKHSYFEIKYGLHLPDQKQMSVVGIHEGKVIGFFGAIPHEFLLEGRSYSMLFTCDYFLLESFRGKGVFDRIYRFVKEQAIEQNYDYFYTFDSAQTHKFGQKMGWSKAPSFVGMDWMVIPQTVKSVFERTLGASWSKNRLRKLLAPFETELTVDQLPETSMRFDSNFLEMKQFTDHYFVELHGCKVWLKHDYRLTIGFIDMMDDGDLELMLSQLKRMARKSGIHQIVMHLRPNDPFLDQIKKHGDAFEGYNASYLPLKKNLPEFERFTTHFIQGDMF